jgi:uncharacterized protein DUF3618
MGEDTGKVGAAVGSEEQKSPEELRREIEETREELGDTAAALAEKTDFKARARERVDGLKQTVAVKKEAVASKVGSGDASGDGGAGAQASAVAAQARTKAQENPVATAALAAFVGGFLFGRITSR